MYADFFVSIVSQGTQVLITMSLKIRPVDVVVRNGSKFQSFLQKYIYFIFKAEELKGVVRHKSPPCSSWQQ